MAKKNQTPPKNFEDAVRELEQILNEMEGGDVPLEQSLEKYERGTFLLQHCRSILNTAEKQIEQISQTMEGELKTEPMQENSESGEP